MSYSYDQYERQTRRQTYGASSRRTTFGYWIPLAFTVTAATVGLVAWIWNERKHDDDEYNDRKGDGRPPGGYNENLGPGGVPYPNGPGTSQVEDESVITRVSGALRRTPSPQQIFDGASKRVVAGVAAAGAAVGGALSSIREEDKDFEDHSRWSEEAEGRVGGPNTQRGPESRTVGDSSSVRNAPPSGMRTGGKRKSVAIVVSAETDYHHREDVSYLQEHASILSHLPAHIDSESRIFVLIYAPELEKHPLATQSGQPGASLTSSYSNIGHEDANTPGEDAERPLSSIDPRPISSPPRSKMFDALYAQAQAIVEKDTMIMPFTTPTGHVHLLRHLGPEIVYIQATLAGPGGDAVSHISGWVGQVVLVVGDESGHGGLVDSEDERGASGDEKDRWWQNDSRIGLGKGIEVVEGLRVGEDWRRRVGGHD